ncbi:bifunctional cobalt-precorrin-7 (C(5))-methyltransferase/cobalt-precorrin-6B (C(15))-methyltransferase [Bosea sp. PAMC 26642]|uniref:bifunctional cobalt-precorrin-7 (C(5))-methyltransferase/cobalt-precorrin-6B (C(15))-methyltransferase n=1 Tax=Bosea sp. (strain PAMC 26642) TaxID=1792307 RepID=UPI00077004C6|nr:bifunctional cobalt-precorrin-7 (C(5))-methyltransferase/cobalt-precorrin-6B (C(15))-methyltransferase [Bosea sp. PAMC 26642]AMJ62622.1 precorrin-6Y methyltransferase [Bosea sp. PAMC 26642]
MSLVTLETDRLSSRDETGPWLALIGLGEDGRAGLSPEALAALDDAEIVFGGERHIALVGAVPGELRAWPQPFRNALPAILAERGRKVCVLATSDPFHYGIGAGLTKAIPAQEMRIIPQISSFAMACTRMRWPQEECALVSLHGRTLYRIVPHLQPGARILALSWDETTPRAVAELMSARGLGASRIVVMEALGGPQERVRETRADAFAFDDIVPLNMIAVDVAAGRDSRILPLAPGLDEDWFAHDGQITKSEIRAITISALAPRGGELLWDVGAGSGSVAIEWCQRHLRNRAVAFEAKPERAHRITRNKVELGGLSVEVVGAAPEGFAGRPAPDAVFIGGGLTVEGLFEGAWTALKPGGRLVANVVTIEGEAKLAALHAAHGGSLRRISIDRLAPVGSKHGWRPAMPVTQWRVEKP